MSANQDLEWEKQLPTLHPIVDSITRERFQRVFNNLRDQGITVTYNPDYSGEQLHLWRLEKDYGTTYYGVRKIVGGRLYWFRQLNECSYYSRFFRGE